MKLYHIVEECWNGEHYMADGVRTFSSEQKRDIAIEEIEQSTSYKKGDVSYSCFESELDENDLVHLMTHN